MSAYPLCDGTQFDLDLCSSYICFPSICDFMCVSVLLYVMVFCLCSDKLNLPEDQRAVFILDARLA